MRSPAWRLSGARSILHALSQAAARAPGAGSGSSPSKVWGSHVLSVSPWGGPETRGSDCDPGGNTGEVQEPACRGGALGKDGEAGQVGVRAPKPGLRLHRTQVWEGRSRPPPPSPSSTASFHTQNRARPHPGYPPPSRFLPLRSWPTWPSTPAWAPSGHRRRESSSTSGNNLGLTAEEGTPPARDHRGETAVVPHPPEPCARPAA